MKYEGGKMDDVTCAGGLKMACGQCRKRWAFEKSIEHGNGITARKAFLGLGLREDLNPQAVS